jgi:two-component system, NtrC family, response regulator HupR/HoxA
MINWDEFEHIHVIKKLKQILNSWWNIDVLFTDERGQLKGMLPEKGGYCSPATPVYLSKEAVTDSLQSLVAKSLDDIRATGKRYTIMHWDAVGSDMAVVPVVIDGELMGTVVAMGFLQDGDNKKYHKAIQERLASYGASASVIDQAISKVQSVDADERAHFLELVELVAQEIAFRNHFQRKPHPRIKQRIRQPL